MRNYRELPYEARIKWRIRILWMVAALMLIYMVLLVELGGGDSRMMTDFASQASRVIFFGGLAYIAWRICRNKKLLKDRALLKAQIRMEQDERNQSLRDKSGGIVVDILLIAMLALTFTTALFNMVAFYTSVALLIFTVLLKGLAYLIFSRIQ